MNATQINLTAAIVYGHLIGMILVVLTWAMIVANG